MKLLLFWLNLRTTKLSIIETYNFICDKFLMFYKLRFSIEVTLWNIFCSKDKIWMWKNNTIVICRILKRIKYWFSLKTGQNRDLFLTLFTKYFRIFIIMKVSLSKFGFLPNAIFIKRISQIVKFLWTNLFILIRI